MCLCCPADWEQHGSGCDLCGLRGRGCFQEKKGERDRVCERARACVCVCVCMDTSPERDSYYLEGPLWSERERIFPEKIKDSVCVCVCVCVCWGVYVYMCVYTQTHHQKETLVTWQALCGLRGRRCFQKKKEEGVCVCVVGWGSVCVCVCACIYTDTSPERDSCYLGGVCVCVCVHTDTSPERASYYLCSQHDLCCGTRGPPPCLSWPVPWSVLGAPAC